MNFFHRMLWMFLALGLPACWSDVEFSANPIDVLSAPKTEYSFYLEIREALTMTTKDTKEEAVFWDPETRRFHKRSQRFKNGTCGPGLPLDADGVRINTGDGLHRRIFTVNGSLPGPSLVVHQGAEVTVRLYNALMTETVILHFHGLRQTRNFWHDGAGKLTQCPISPQETFTYRFVAEVPGTYFYHGHFMDDRGDGLEGPLIILPRERPDVVAIPSHSRPEDTSNATAQKMVKIDRQYVGFVQDWYPDLFRDEYLKARWGMGRYSRTSLTGVVTDCYTETRAIDGGRIGQLMWHSALINGRGWHADSDLRMSPFSLPLETFRIAPGSNVLFRFINAGIVFPFVITFQDHRMEVLASDAHEIDPVIVDQLTIFPGERYSVLIRGHPAPPSRQTFLIYVTTIESLTENLKPMDEHYAIAYLKYDAISDNVRSSRTAKSSEPESFDDKHNGNKDGGLKRVALNCPSKKMPDYLRTSCINFDQIKNRRGSLARPALGSGVGSGFAEVFLNIYRDNAVNGLRYAYPLAPPALFEDASAVLFPCSKCLDSPEDLGCKCTNHIHVPLNTTLQLVILNKEKDVPDPGNLDAFAHPIHVHGNPFHVLRVGYPEYQPSGLISDFNQDILCEDAACNTARWSSGAPPELNLVNPPAKDTIAVPVGGYVVLRLEADNPGWWLAHCHMMPHHLAGMAFAIRVGEPSDLPPRPQGFPSCFGH